jgi:hypothetical protein
MPHRYPYFCICFYLWSILNPILLRSLFTSHLSVQLILFSLTLTPSFPLPSLFTPFLSFLSFPFHFYLFLPSSLLSTCIIPSSFRIYSASLFPSLPSLTFVAFQFPFVSSILTILSLPLPSISVLPRFRFSSNFLFFSLLYFLFSSLLPFFFLYI